MDEEWIHASEAYERVQAHIPYRAAEAICERAHDGLIAARAERLILGEKVIEPASPPGFLVGARASCVGCQMGGGGLRNLDRWPDSLPRLWRYIRERRHRANAARARDCT
jgi:hypothetical protein